MGNASKLQNGTHAAAKPSEIGRLAREIRRLDDTWNTLTHAEDAIERRHPEQSSDDYEAGRARFLIGQATTVGGGKVDALRRLLAFETPKNFEDVATLFCILMDELRHFHLEYIDPRWSYDADDMAALGDRREPASDREQHRFGQHEKRVDVLIRSLFLALHELAPSPLMRDRDVKEERARVAIDDIVETAQKVAGGAHG